MNKRGSTSTKFLLAAIGVVLLAIVFVVVYNVITTGEIGFPLPGQDAFFDFLDAGGFRDDASAQNQTNQTQESSS